MSGHFDTGQNVRPPNNFNYGPTNSWVIGESKAVARGRIRSQYEREKRYI